MSIEGIEAITYGVTDLPTCRRYFLDWGLEIVGEKPGRVDFETLNGCGISIVDAADPSLPPAIEEGSTVREVAWGAESAADVARAAKGLAGAPGFFERDGETGCTDPNGLAIRVRVSRKRKIDLKGTPVNTWGNKERINAASPVYERARPVEVGHVVFFTNRLDEVASFYRERLGFTLSDSYPGRGIFLRCAPEGGHHDLFLLQLPVTKKAGLNHVAFTVRDIHEVFGGGMHISRSGWTTEIGPGRHPISSAYFWYVKCPAGGLTEYYTDEDWLTAEWQAREFQPTPELFAEWAVTGGIDGRSRRQAVGPSLERGTAGSATRSHS